MSIHSTILVPTDFSRKSESAIRYACEIALCTGADILFLNVVEPHYDFPSRMEEMIESLKKDNAEKLEVLINDLHSVDDFRFIKMKGKVLVGNAAIEILNAADSGKYGLICVGLGGEQDLKKTLYGSITNKLLLDSPIPVFAISKHLSYRNTEQLLFATDFRDRDLKPAKQARRLARDLGAVLRVIHIVEDKKRDKEIEAAFTEKLRSVLKEPDFEIEFYEDKTFLEGIVRVIGNKKQTVIVTTRYKQSFLEWLISKSSARTLAQIANVPLLLIPSDVKN
jgi:nucleotide-binding universal stress UspA family protein